MKTIFAVILSLVFTVAAFGQTEQAPVSESNIAYKDWTYKNLKGGGETNLRNFSKGKKLVMVVYWAPWCPNWKHDIELVKSLHEKYGDKGLSIIGIGEYDSTGKMKSHVEQNDLKFPIVYESDSTGARMTSAHYGYRTASGDRRKWGTPWYVFLEPAKLSQEGEELTTATTIVNGELIKDDAEKYIRGKLGL